MVDVKVLEEKSNPRVSHRYVTEFWEVSLPDKMSDDLKQKIEKLVDARKDWATELYETFIGRMAYQKIKDRNLDINQVEWLESLLAIIQAWKDKVQLREVSKQKEMGEFDESLGKVSRGPKPPVLDKEERRSKKSVSTAPLKGPGKPLKNNKGKKK